MTDTEMYTEECGTEIVWEESKGTELEKTLHEDDEREKKENEEEEEEEEEEGEEEEKKKDKRDEKKDEKNESDEEDKAEKKEEANDGEKQQNKGHRIVIDMTKKVQYTIDMTLSPNSNSEVQITQIVTPVNDAKRNTYNVYDVNESESEDEIEFLGYTDPSDDDIESRYTGSFIASESEDDFEFTQRSIEDDDSDCSRHIIKKRRIEEPSDEQY